MTLPAFLLGLLISSLYGAAFHLWKGGGPGRLLLYLLLSWVGFWAGHYLAGYAGVTFASVGPLHLGPATLASLVFLLLGHWLSLIQREESR